MHPTGRHVHATLTWRRQGCSGDIFLSDNRRGAFLVSQSAYIYLSIFEVGEGANGKSTAGLCGKKLLYTCPLLKDVCRCWGACNKTFGAFDLGSRFFNANDIINYHADLTLKKVNLFVSFHQGRGEAGRTAVWRHWQVRQLRGK